MKTNQEQNVITQRLDILNARYEEFRDNPDAKICLWLIQRDEMPMLEAFFNFENTEHGNFPDLFLRFESAFEKAEQYQRALFNEFQNFLQQEKEALENDGMDLSFLARLDFRQTSFLPALSAFGQAVPDFQDGNVVAWLSPEYVTDYTIWENWLVESLERGFPPKVRLMLACTAAEHTFSSLRATFPKAFVTIVPHLDMPAAIRQLAASGDRNDPGTQFRVHFVEMGQAASSGNFEKMQSEGLKAVNIAQQQLGWEHLEVAAYVAMGNAMLREKSRHSESLQFFEKACQSGNRAVQSGNPVGAVVLCQAMFAKGVAYLNVKEFGSAAQVYESIVPVSKEVKNGAFQTMEAWRMAGYCHEQGRQAQHAWDCNLAAFHTAEDLDEQIRTNSTLPYIGQALIRLSETLGKHQQLPQIRQKLETWVGPNWEAQTNHQKINQN